MIIEMHRLKNTLAFDAHRSVAFIGCDAHNGIIHTPNLWIARVDCACILIVTVNRNVFDTAFFGAPIGSAQIAVVGVNC